MKDLVHICDDSDESVFISPQWEELKAAKPVDGEEDPELLEEIAEARKNLGQFTRGRIQ